MQIAQRSSSVTSITTDGFYTADRYYTSVNTLGTWTQSVESDAPAGSGLHKSLKMLCTTADAAPSAADYCVLYQSVEGVNLQTLCKGTASAQPLTLTFWTKSNTTGTYVVSIYDQDNNRRVSASYSVVSSGTWEAKKVVFPADTAGALDYNSDASLTFQFWLSSGTNFTSGILASAWESNVNANAAVGQTNLAAATNNYWQVTGIQLEVGGGPSQFQFKTYEQELSECQRYYEVCDFVVNAAGQGFQNVFYKVQKRTSSPNLTLIAGAITPAVLNYRSANYFTVDGLASINAAVSVSSSADI